MRVFHKAWQDRRPNPTRRVRWYRGLGGGLGEMSRLEFMDEDRKMNMFYDSDEAAQEDMDRFAAGTLTTAELMDRKEGIS